MTGSPDAPGIPGNPVTRTVADAASDVAGYPLDVRREGDIVWLTLNRPEAGNALDQSMAEALLAAVRGIRDAGPSVVVLRGAGKVFCAGGDVAAMAAASDQTSYLTTLAATVHEALAELRDADIILLAAVHGAAAGAGLGLALHADVVVASPSARLLSAYGAVGLSPDCGVSWLLPQMVGSRRAVELTMTGRVLDAKEAREWGIVTFIAESGDLDGRVRVLAESLAQGPLDAFIGTRHLINRPADSYEAQLSAEVEGLGRRMRTADTRERIAVFAARQKPKATAQ